MDKFWVSAQSLLMLLHALIMLRITVICIVLSLLECEEIFIMFFSGAPITGVQISKNYNTIGCKNIIQILNWLYNCRNLQLSKVMNVKGLFAKLLSIVHYFLICVYHTLFHL